MSVELYTVTPHGVTRRYLHTADDVNNLLFLHRVALGSLNHPTYQHDKQLREALLHVSIDALLDARLEFAAREAATSTALLREWWVESYPGTEPPQWPADQPSELAA